MIAPRQTQTPWILLPGMDGTGDLFEPFTASISSVRPTQIIPYPTDEIWSFDDYLHHIEESLPTTTGFILIAESFSGPLAIQLAATRRIPKLKALVLVATFATPPLAQPLRAAARILAPLITKIAPPSIFIRALMTGFKTPTQLAHAVQESIRKVQPQVLASRLKLVVTTSQLENLRNIQRPILILNATHDRLVTRAATNALNAAVPSARIESIPSPHLILQSNPTEAVRILDSFTEQVPSG